MRPTACVLLAALAVAGCGGDDAAAPTATRPPPGPVPTITAGQEARSCGQVAYQAGSDSGAFQIVATNTTCPVAEAVARAAENRSEAFRSRGFECNGAIDQNAELRSFAWVCKRPGARITFSTS